ncbi:branched-chain amino acid transport system II carrier protein [Polaribacter gangjinensis]|uniref:Branched-chain amino acid ABC transporter substrate-binding protein n=1 Tax=Polaribacter gangjinensis TaxID=574710 RepID=A0A2S7WD69_9FLAO|nr:branched-chain amino acid transport system II carrier protein [Polaribacter gangjinensis]PQJ75564.1 branched-chain amino acid ABC transporter substrate-binding protein [Polaribacter gangjinensis]
MNSFKSKEIWISGFALFSLFFGAGNLILPTSLGLKAGFNWWIVLLGFALTAVFIPILSIFAHAKLQGTLFDFGKKVSPVFSTIFCLLTYTIAIAIPGPRTAAVTHEMAIQPFFDVSPLLTSSIYFGLVFVFVINRSKIIDVIGKFLTPIIVIILLIIIVLAIISSPENNLLPTIKSPFVDGILEGYQTFDAIAGVVVGAVMIVSLNLGNLHTFDEKKNVISKSGLIAGFGLLLIYGGLIFSGFLFSATFPENATRIDILTSLSLQTLGDFGRIFLSVLVALACFTTAVGVVTGTADYIKGICKNSQKAFVITTGICAIIGILVGSFQVDFIIILAVPALMFLYPITIVLIVLNVLPNKYGSKLVFRAVVFTTFLFSIPDFLGFIIDEKYLVTIKNIIPLANNNLGWVLPSLLVFVVVNFWGNNKIDLTEI